MNSNTNQTYTLNSIMEEAVEHLHVDRTTAYRRFRKFHEEFFESIGDMKNDDGEIVFTADEKEFVVGVIKEMDNPKLMDFLRQKPSKGNLLEAYQEAKEFQDRMMVYINKVQDDETRKKFEYIIETVAKVKLRELAVEQHLKYGVITEYILNLKLSYEETIAILQDINDRFDRYMKELKTKYPK